MALTDAEHKRLIKLWASCLDKDGKPRPDALTKELKELNDLIGKTSPDEPIHPVRIKDYKPSEVARQLIEEKAEFQGAELRKAGTPQKPIMILREWFYRGKGKDRKAVFVQNGAIIEAGRTIAASAYARFQR